jgi:hypothetical protein
MTAPGDANFFATNADAIYRNAQRAGLTWRLMVGTVASSSSSITSIDVLMDGDTQEITRAQSLVGSVSAGVRVMVMVVPPQGNYIIGFYEQPQLPIIQSYTTPGTTQWVDAGEIYIDVECVGSGASAGGSGVTAAGQHSQGGGGGGGGYSKSRLFRSNGGIPSTADVLVAAGVAGSLGGAGTNGNQSSFNISQVIALGGLAGAVRAASAAAIGSAGGAGAAVGTGDLALPGDAGTFAWGDAGLGVSGKGGSSGYGMGGGGAGREAGGAGNALAGNAGTGYGGGGGGALSTASAGAATGGAGAQGIVIVTSYFR